MQLRIDLHTHSQASPDGSLQAKHYRRMFAECRLTFIGVTDHNTISFAQELNRQLGDRIIVGEEITTSEGELVGLYLQKAIQPGMSARKTAQAICSQNGLVYVPHPFETVRKGITMETLSEIADLVDIIEVHNGRAVFQNYSQQAGVWANIHGVPGAASSDTHGMRGWGRTYSVLSQPPTRDTLVALLADAQLHTAFPGVPALLYPKFNRLRKKVKHVH